MTPTEITTLLASMGSTADEVADELRRRGVKGQRQACDICPLAKVAGVDILDCDFELDGVLYLLPNAAQAFVDRFDQGYYPDLEEKPEVMK